MKRLIFLAVVSFGFLSLNLPHEEGDQKLSLKMYVTTYSHDYVFNDGELMKGILLNTRDRHFYAMISNETDEEVMIWEEMNTWGYSNLYFEVMDANNKVVHTIKKNTIHKFADGSAEPLIISPFETYVREVNFSERQWTLPTQEDLPEGSYKYYPEVYRKSKAFMTITIRAVFEIKEKHEELNNWTGRIVSTKQKVNLVYPWEQVIQHATE